MHLLLTWLFNIILALTKWPKMCKFVFCHRAQSFLSSWVPFQNKNIFRTYLGQTGYENITYGRSCLVTCPIFNVCLRRSTSKKIAFTLALQSLLFGNLTFGTSQSQHKRSKSRQKHRIKYSNFGTFELNAHVLTFLWILHCILKLLQW